MPLLAGARLVAVDTETTGFDPSAGHELIEVACVTLADGEVGETWSSLVRPARPIPPDATRIHGISDAMVALAPGPAEVAALLARACGDAPLVFHNARFDLPFLAALLRAGGLPPLSNPIIDTLGLARGILSAKENSLAALARELNLPPETAHRAAGDARTTARLLLHLAPRWEEKHPGGSLAELAAASQDVERRTRRGPDRIGGEPARGERAREPAAAPR
jgi:DNA polymerase III epsilon subunit family exonuclease